MQDEKELVDFFLDGDSKRKNELLEILGKIVFEDAPINGCSVNDIDLSEEYHKSKIIYYYNEISE